MSQSAPPCELKPGYPPTVFVVGQRHNVVVYSRCKGTMEWTVAGTDDWMSDASKKPNSEGYYTYRLRPRWHHTVTNEEGIRCRFRPLPPDEREPITLTLALIVEAARYSPRPRDNGDRRSPEELAHVLLTLVLWLATAVFGLWAIGDLVTDIWPALLLVFTPHLGAGEQRKLYDVSANCLALLLGVIWLGVVIGGGEYHRRWIGHPRSWKLFGVTLAVEGAILVIALFT